MSGEREIPARIVATRAELGSFRNATGLRIQTYHWPATGAHSSAPKGVVLAVHGVSTYLCFEFLKYAHYPDSGASGYDGASFMHPVYEGSWVERLNSEGFAFVGMDLQSYGLSEGARGQQFFFEKFRDHVDDQIQFRKSVQELYPNTPIFALGLSMGGCIAAHLVEQDQDFAYAGLVLLAPMLSLEQLKAKPVNKVLLPLSDYVSRMAPMLRLAKKEGHPRPEMAKHFKADELNEQTNNIRVRVASECLHAVDDARNNVDLIKCPLLAVHAANDTMTDVAGSQYAYEHASGKSKTLLVLPDKHMWHELVNEPNNAALLERVVGWLHDPETPLV